MDWRFNLGPITHANASSKLIVRPVTVGDIVKLRPRTGSPREYEIVVLSTPEQETGVFTGRTKRVHGPAAELLRNEVVEFRLRHVFSVASANESLLPWDLNTGRVGHQAGFAEGESDGDTPLEVGDLVWLSADGCVIIVEVLNLRNGVGRFAGLVVAHNGTPPTGTADGDDVEFEQQHVFSITRSRG